MKKPPPVRINPNMTIARAIQLARGLGCLLIVKAGQAYLVRNRANSHAGGKHA